MEKSTQIFTIIKYQKNALSNTRKISRKDKNYYS